MKSLSIWKLPTLRGFPIVPLRQRIDWARMIASMRNRTNPDMIPKVQTAPITKTAAIPWRAALSTVRANGSLRGAAGAGALSLGINTYMQPRGLVDPGAKHEADIQRNVGYLEALLAALAGYRMPGKGLLGAGIGSYAFSNWRTQHVNDIQRDNMRFLRDMQLATRAGDTAKLQADIAAAQAAGEQSKRLNDRLLAGGTVAAGAGLLGLGGYSLYKLLSNIREQSMARKVPATTGTLKVMLPAQPGGTSTTVELPSTALPEYMYKGIMRDVRTNVRRSVEAGKRRKQLPVQMAEEEAQI